MKKILLSCACCLLAVGLLAGCDNEEEVVTPDEPDTTVPSTGGDDGGSGEGGEATTYLFGVEIDGVLSYVTGATQSQGAYRGVLSADVSEAVAISCEQSENTYYLSFDNEGVTNWITIVSGEHTNLSYATEKSPIYLHTTDGGAEYFGDEGGENFLCYNKAYDCLYASSVDSYLESSPVAGLYTTDGKLVAGGIGEEPDPDPEPVGMMVEQGTGVLGLYQGNKGAYYYITGEITTSGSNTFLEMTTSYSDAAEVTIWKDDVYYYLTVGEEGDLKYIACPDTTKSSVALTSDPYCLQYNEEYDAWLTGNGVEFLATYSTFETMSWANVSRYLGDESEFIAHIYEEEQKLPAPEAGSITISGATSVYVDSTITLTAVIPTGYDSSVEWSIDNDGYATIEENSGLTCVVKGVSEGSATVTVKSTANPEAYATATISVVPVPTGVTLLGSFDFSSIAQADSNAISDDTALDDFWTGSSDVYVSLRQHDTIYLGGGGSYSPSNSVDCLKFGSGSANGTAELKFALGTSVTQVVITASGWADSNGVAAATLTINGVSQDCATTGEPGELTYDIADSWTNLVKMEASARLTVHSIDIYGTYTTNFGEITTLFLTSDVGTLNIGETTEITVSWDSDVPFDIDTLGWSSDNENAINVEANYDGASAHAYSTGEATITAKAENGVEGTITLTAVDVLQETETFTFGDGNNSQNYDSLSFYGHQATITFAKGSGSTAPAWYNPFRVYTANTITFTPTYEGQGVTISSIEIKCNGTYYGNAAAEFTDSIGNSAGTIDNPKSSGCTITLTPTEGITGALTYTNWYEAEHTTTSGQTQLRIESITIRYTLPTT